MAKELSRSSYLEKNVGNYPETIEIAGKTVDCDKERTIRLKDKFPAASGDFAPFLLAVLLVIAGNDAGRLRQSVHIGFHKMIGV